MSKLFWVNVGSTYKEVLEEQFLWAPNVGYTNNGSTFVNAGWKAVQEVKKGDVILVHKNKNVLGLAKATKDAYEAPRPETRNFSTWEETGTKVDIELNLFPAALQTSTFVDAFFDIYNNQCSPAVFTVNKSASQSYMCKVPVGAASLIFDQQNTPLMDVKVDTESDSIEVDTSSEAIVKVRKGQQKFRQRIVKYWNGQCCLTGLDKTEILIASHIVPWELASNKERLDKFNGLLLSPNADKLFDKGFISFDKSGRLIKGSNITDDELAALGLNSSMKIKGLSEPHLKYLARHRVLFSFN